VALVALSGKRIVKNDQNQRTSQLRRLDRGHRLCGPPLPFAGARAAVARGEILRFRVMGRPRSTPVSARSTLARLFWARSRQPLRSRFASNSPAFITSRSWTPFAPRWPANSCWAEYSRFGTSSRTPQGLHASRWPTDGSGGFGNVKEQPVLVDEKVRMFFASRVFERSA
jgi:hypothetical protein